MTALRISAIRRALRVDDQVHITLPHPRLRVRQPGVLLRQRTQRLGGDREGVGQHGQLAAPRRDHLAGHPDVVPEVDVALPRRPARPRRPGRGEIMTWMSPVPSRMRGEAELAADPGQHDPAGHPDLLAGRGVRRQVRVAFADLGDAWRCAGTRPGRGRRPPPAAARAWPAGPASAPAGRAGRSRVRARHRPGLIVSHPEEATGRDGRRSPSKARARRQPAPGGADCPCPALRAPAGTAGTGP